MFRELPDFESRKDGWRMTKIELVIPQTAVDVIVDDTSRGKAGCVIQMNDGRELPVGRNGASRLRFAAGTLSGRHCNFQVQNGVLHVMDTTSRNGTFINGQRITVFNQWFPLKDGDVVQIVDTPLTVRIRDAGENDGAALASGKTEVFSSHPTTVG